MSAYLTSTMIAVGVRAGKFARRYDTFADALADTTGLETGEIVTIKGYRYQVVDTDGDVQRADGAQFKVLPHAGWIWDEQLFDTANDADRVNKAIALALARMEAGELVRVGVLGSYTMDKPIKLFRRYGAGLYASVSACLMAPAPGYSGGKRTQFTFTDDQNPGIVIHKARNVVLRNIALLGSAQKDPVDMEVILARESWWNTAGAVDEGTFKRYTGICIDPFYEGMDAADKFSHFDGSGAEPDHYTAPASDGSTQILIEDCAINSWVVGVMTAASPIQIGDSITLNRPYFQSVGYPVVIGESQNRGVCMNDGHAKNFDVLWASGSGYGANTGSGNYINGGVFVIGYALLDVDMSRGSGAASNVYAESLVSIGNVTGPFTWSFNDCHVKLSDMRRGPAYHLDGNGRVNFNGGYVGKYRNEALPLLFKGWVTINGTSFDAPPVIAGTNWPRVFSLSVRYGDYAGVVGDPFIGQMGRAEYAPFGMLHHDQNGDVFQCRTPPGYIDLGTATASINGSGQVVLSGLDVSNIFVGDTLQGRNSGVQMTWNLGRVIEIDGGDVVLKDTSTDIVAGDTFNVLLSAWPTVRPPETGTTTSGGATVTGSFGTGDWHVGTPIRGTGIPAGARVLSCSTTEIVMTKAATASGEVEIHDGQLVRL